MRDTLDRGGVLLGRRATTLDWRCDTLDWPAPTMVGCGMYAATDGLFH